MRIALFICIVALLTIAANYLMKILDRYMRMSKKAKTSLLIAFDNPLIIDSFKKEFQRFTDQYPYCQLNFLYGNDKQIKDNLVEGKVDVALVENVDNELSKIFYQKKIVTKATDFPCKKDDFVVSPLDREVVTNVIWKKRIGKSDIVRFTNIICEK